MRPETTTTLATSEPDIRCLCVDDLEQIVAIDHTHTGRARRRFFQRRLEAAKAHPGDFVHVGMVRGGALRGYAMARLQRGEFGQEDVVAVFDAIGVQEEGLGQALMDGLVTTLRSRGARRLQSQAEWVSHAVLRFLDASGFELAPRIVLERSVSEPLAEAVDDT